MSFPSHVATFIDESGDLGFTEKSSQYFVVSYVIPHQWYRVNVALKRLRKKLKDYKGFSGEEFKFSHDSSMKVAT